MAATAITNSIVKYTPGFGIASNVTAVLNALTATATKTLTIPSCTNGYVRIKWSGAAASTTATFQVSLTDGTTVYEILPTTVVTTAGDAANFVIPFVLDISVVTLTVISTLAGAATTGNLDMEVAGNP